MNEQAASYFCAYELKWIVTIQQNARLSVNTASLSGAPREHVNKAAMLKSERWGRERDFESSTLGMPVWIRIYSYIPTVCQFWIVPEQNFVNLRMRYMDIRVDIRVLNNAKKM